MDKKSKVLLWVVALMIAASVGVTFWRIMIKKDYIIEAEVDCDPTTETCFIYECDPEAEECTGNPEEDISYFKKAKRTAANIPLCDPSSEDCLPFVCNDGEKDCEEILCSDETKEEGEVCNDPEQYNIDNPVEEEGVVECDPSDAECVEAEIEGAVCEEGGDEECAVDIVKDENEVDAVDTDSVDENNIQ